jgi:sterol desaturase/sphingolipid hydroxylase (fatty acid hydroxylase superfamily)
MNWILAGPELHRFHHSASFEESNTNFGSNLIIWDVIFRTRHLPKDMHVAAIGLEEKVFQHNYWQQLAVPFQWRLYMKKARMRAAAVAEHPLSQMWTSPPPSSPS